MTEIVVLVCIGLHGIPVNGGVLGSDSGGVVLMRIWFKPVELQSRMIQLQIKLQV